MGDQRPDLVAVGALAVTASIGLFKDLLPPLSAVRRSDDAETKADVRLGELAGSGLIIGIGAVMSLLLHAKEPFLLAVLIAAGLTATYEKAVSM